MTRVMSCVWAFVLALVWFPGLALAQDGPVRVSQWRPVAAVSVTDGASQTWRESAVGIERPAGDGWTLTRAEVLERSRPATREHQLRLAAAGPGGWQVEASAAPNAISLPQAGLRVGRTGKWANDTVTLVPGLFADARSWRTGTMVGVGPTVEIYPKSGAWRASVGAQVGSFEGTQVGGGFASVTVPVTRKLDMVAVLGAGREVDEGRVLRTSTVSVGVAIPVLGEQRLEVSAQRETRARGAERTGFQVRLARVF